MPKKPTQEQIDRSIESQKDTLLKIPDKAPILWTRVDENVPTDKEKLIMKLLEAYPGLLYDEIKKGCNTTIHLYPYLKKLSSKGRIERRIVVVVKGGRRMPTYAYYLTKKKPLGT